MPAVPEMTSLLLGREIVLLTHQTHDPSVISVRCERKLPSDGRNPRILPACLDLTLEPPALEAQEADLQRPLARGLARGAHDDLADRLGELLVIQPEPARRGVEVLERSRSGPGAARPTTDARRSAAPGIRGRVRPLETHIARKIRSQRSARVAAPPARVCRARDPTRLLTHLRAWHQWREQVLGEVEPVRQPGAAARPARPTDRQPRTSARAPRAPRPCLQDELRSAPVDDCLDLKLQERGRLFQPL